MKVKDAADRAQDHRRPGLLRVDLGEIFWWPENRGGLGTNPRHVHNIAQERMTNKVRQERYKYADLIEVTGVKAEQIKAVNKARYDDEPLLPGSLLPKSSSFP